MPSISGLFLEREISAPGGPPLSEALQLLVVDACSERRGLRELFAELERRAPVSIALADLATLIRVPKDARFDRVWLALDAGSDDAYCAVVEAELAARFPDAKIEVLAVGDIDGRGGAHQLTLAQAGGVPAWRRGREVARGAACAAGFLGAGKAT